MKLVTAVIRPEKLEDVRSKLLDVGVKGLTVTPVQGVGRQRGVVEIYRGAEFDPGMLSKVKLEILIPDDMVDAVSEVIVSNAHTGAAGDGKVWTVDVLGAVRVRTGEKGESAL